MRGNTGFVFPPALIRERRINWVCRYAAHQAA
jgi:hypothetical protein